MRINTKLLRKKLSKSDVGYYYLSDMGLNKTAVKKIINNGKCKPSTAGIISNALHIPLNVLAEV